MEEIRKITDAGCHKCTESILSSAEGTSKILTQTEMKKIRKITDARCHKCTDRM